jgi:hypothetical protein
MSRWSSHHGHTLTFPWKRWEDPSFLREVGWTGGEVKSLVKLACANGWGGKGFFTLSHAHSTHPHAAVSKIEAMEWGQRYRSTIYVFVEGDRPYPFVEGLWCEPLLNPTQKVNFMQKWQRVTYPPMPPIRFPYMPPVVPLGGERDLWQIQKEG